jgi:hypothetical protein
VTTAETGNTDQTSGDDPLVPVQVNEATPHSQPTGNQISISDKWIIGLTAVIAATGIIAACIFGKQLNVMQGQLEIMQANERPYIGTPEIKVSKSTINSGIIDFTLIFKNVGHSPTRGLRADAEIVPFAEAATPNYWLTSERDLCLKNIQWAKDFPTEFTARSSIPGSDWPIPIKEMSGTKSIILTLDYLKAIKLPFIIGCAIYKSPFDDLIRQTGFFAPIEIKEDGISVPYVVPVEPN